MAEIVAAIACGHAPGMGTRPEPDPAGQKERVYDFYKATRARLAATNPTAVIVVSDEHIQNFFFNNWPTFCLAYPERMEGPIEGWMPIPHYELAGYPDFGAARRDPVHLVRRQCIEQRQAGKKILDLDFSCTHEDALP